MKQETQKSDTLAVPKGIGRAIVRSGAVIAAPLLGTDNFVRWCKDRGLNVDRKRLIRLERLGLFSPVFRVRTPKTSKSVFDIPPNESRDWFSKCWAWDTTSVDERHVVPDPTDRTQEGYYSVFQIDHLDLVLGSVDMTVRMDEFLESSLQGPVEWESSGARMLEYTSTTADLLRKHEFRRGVALLCQYISNRYYPQSQSDQRTIQVSNRTYVDTWIRILSFDFDWWDYAAKWDPSEVAHIFDLSPRKLKHAYEALAVAQAHCDPMERWYQLVQFISVRKRRTLKGEALRAEALRDGAYMLRLLYKDLYDDELPHPNEVLGEILEHVPELEIRRDSRRYLEFVVNGFGINPQPTVCLIVEGPSEEWIVNKIFEKWFGVHPGAYGIELLVLGGVGNATGGKSDRYSAILRLIDYLHHHQTFAFVILDNEGQVPRLKKRARTAKSIHHRSRHVTRPEYLKVWRTTFEFDNFSATEIAKALSAVSPRDTMFLPSEVAACLEDKKNPNAALNRLYGQKCHRDIPKVQLAEYLGDLIFLESTRKKPENRPIVKVLERVVERAARNPFPTMLSIWERNQSSKYFGKKS